jgi:LPXTG-site transpeptidase (sortase) family protein
MTRDSLLRWLERGLLAVGVALAAWCAAVLVEARFHNSAPPPPSYGQLKVTQTLILPGDAGTKKTAPAPSAGMVIGRLEAPSVKMSTTVLEGSDDATLSRGAGHIEDTPFPGESGNVGIAGHRDTVFRPLKRIQVGDPLELTTADRLYRYRISKTLIVGPNDVYVLDPTKTPTMTLVTCYPFEYVGHAPRRFIVQAELLKEEARSTR